MILESILSIIIGNTGWDLAKTGGRRLLNQINPDNDLDTEFDKAVQDMACTSYIVISQLLRSKLGNDISEEEVFSLLKSWQDDPSFKHRIYRLFQEGIKTEDEDRRVMLSMVLYGLQDSDLGNSVRERIDMVIERLFPQDIIGLEVIYKVVGEKYEATLGTRLNLENIYHFIMPAGYPIANNNWVDTEYEENNRIETLTLTNLITTGCILHLKMETAAKSGIVQFGTIQITDLGKRIIRELSNLREKISNGGSKSNSG